MVLIPFDIFYIFTFTIWRILSFSLDISFHQYAVYTVHITVTCKYCIGMWGRLSSSSSHKFITALSSSEHSRDFSLYNVRANIQNQAKLSTKNYLFLSFFQTRSKKSIFSNIFIY